MRMHVLVEAETMKMSEFYVIVRRAKGSADAHDVQQAAEHLDGVKVAAREHPTDQQRKDIRAADLELFRAYRRMGNFAAAKQLTERWKSEGWLDKDQEYTDRVAKLEDETGKPYDQIT